jgi:hypothetical protein
VCLTDCFWYPCVIPPLSCTISIHPGRWTGDSYGGLDVFLPFEPELAGGAGVLLAVGVLFCFEMMFGGIDEVGHSNRIGDGQCARTESESAKSGRELHADLLEAVSKDIRIGCRDPLWMAIQRIRMSRHEWACRFR